MSNDNPDQYMNCESSRRSMLNMDILDYMLLIAKYKRFIVSFTLSITTLTIIICLNLKNIYTANAMIIVSEDDKGLMGALMGSAIGGGASALTGLGGPTKTDLYVTMLKTETVKKPIVDRFKLMEIYKSKYMVNAYRRLGANTNIQTGKKDGVITISVNDTNSQRAADIANAYVDELGKLAASVNMIKSGKNRKYLEERLQEAKQNLLKAENDIKSYQQKHKILDLPEQARVSIKSIAQLHSKLAMQEIALTSLRSNYSDTSYEVKSALAVINSIKAQIDKLEGSGDNRVIPTIGSSPELGQEYVHLSRNYKVHETLYELFTKQFELARFSEMKDVSPVQVIQEAKPPELKSKPAKRKIVVVMALFSLVLSIVLVIAREYTKQLSVNTTNRLYDLKSTMFW